MRRRFPLSSVGPVATQVRTFGHRPGQSRMQKVLNRWSETQVGGLPLP